MYVSILLCLFFIFLFPCLGLYLILGNWPAVIRSFSTSTEQSEHCYNKVLCSFSWVMHTQSLIHTYQLSHSQRDSPDFWSKIDFVAVLLFLPLSHLLFYWILSTNQSLNLIIFIKFVRMSRFQTKNPAFEEVCPTFLNRQVGSMI